MKALVVLVAVLSGCVRTVERREIIVQRLIDPAPAARALPACALPALGDTSGWRRDPGERIALPPIFTTDTARLPPHIAGHGGHLWTDPSGRTFARRNGHWDVSQHPSACHVNLNGALTVIAVGRDTVGHGKDTTRHWVDAWPVSRSAATTPRYDAVGASADDQQLFLRILQTYRAPDED